MIQPRTRVFDGSAGSQKQGRAREAWCEACGRSASCTLASPHARVSLSGLPLGLRILGGPGPRPGRYHKIHLNFEIRIGESQKPCNPTSQA